MDHKYSCPLRSTSFFARITIKMAMIFEVISDILTFQRTCILKNSQNRINIKYESSGKYVPIPVATHSKA